MDHCLLLLDDPCWLSTSSTEQSSGLLAEFRVEVVASRCSRFALSSHSHSHSSLSPLAHSLDMSDTPSSESPPPLDSSSGPPVPPPLDPPPLPPDLSSLLSRLPPTPVPQGLPHFPSTPREQPKQTRETTDERCWISTNQSNARRSVISSLLSLLFLPLALPLVLIKVNE